MNCGLIPFFVTSPFILDRDFSLGFQHHECCGCPWENESDSFHLWDSSMISVDFTEQINMWRLFWSFTVEWSSFSSINGATDLIIR